MRNPKRKTDRALSRKLKEASSRETPTVGYKPPEQVFSKEQEKELREYLQVASAMHYGLSPRENKIILDPLTFSEARFRPSLEERLESIISGAALMADSSCTRDDRRERIVAECNAVRQALQDLLSEYMNNTLMHLMTGPFET
ncbi:hypothetical protein AAFF_G00358750 [Aldrovandia affinis]|uniref:Uncharacterized protein n=1 Tax=Aldrovandia affinis TaxID=143900 RepID=A0AAD7T9S6_9TELE|nr:hypothetical protein AAFF_G00358750 [Aldrovandia affinis]